jgi:16S rRNA (cytosine1402-N4)-methyltransferase
MIARVAPARPGERPIRRRAPSRRCASRSTTSSASCSAASKRRERILKPGGRLAVVTFHSLEDRIVKQFFARAPGAARRFAPVAGRAAPPPPTFRLAGGQPVTPGAAELAANPRARSAKLRFAERADAPPRDATPRSRR